MNFKELGLVDVLLKTLEEEGYENPSKIQEEAIPLILNHQDVFGIAQTGTGKTAAFALPILQLLSQKHGKGLRTLVVTPTRELALQIEESFNTYGRHLHLRTVCVFGGVGSKPQIAALKKQPDIIVATPGRLLDLYQQGHISFQRLDTLVLDEADRMLDMGFVHDIKKIIALLPKKRQTLLFSATCPNDIKKLLPSVLKADFTSVEVTPVSSTVELINQAFYYVDNARKNDLLLEVIKERPQVLVFARTKARANRIVKKLMQEGIGAAAIHGDKSQNARVKALQSFKDKELQVLVATDLAARGIDIDELMYVINYDLPNVAETYVHRIGRSGRAGNKGEAISFVSFDEIEDLKNIEKTIKRPLEELPSPFPMQVFEKKEVSKNQPKPKRNPAIKKKKEAVGEGRATKKPTSSTTKEVSRKERKEEPSKSKDARTRRTPKANESKSSGTTKRTFGKRNESKSASFRSERKPKRK